MMEAGEEARRSTRTNRHHPPHPPYTPPPPPAYHPVEGPCAWTAADYAAGADAYAVRLSAADLKELDAAIAATAAVDAIHTIALADVAPHLPTLGPKLTAVRDDVVSGRGFALIRGFPVDRLSRRDAVAGYWIMGLFWGSARPNNKKVEKMVGEVVGWMAFA